MEFVDLKTQQARVRAQIEQRIRDVLDHGQYIMGPEVHELEERLARYVGVDHAIAVSSGTDALLVSLMALEVGSGHEVIIPSFSFAATAEVVVLLGATPIFVDVDIRTGNIDPCKVEASVTAATRAIIPVSLYGQCADITAINEIAQTHDLPVIEDGAQSFGATHHGIRSGALSTIGCTSFFPSKPLGAYGDAGACFTNDARLALRMREIRVHGQQGRYHHAFVGLNARMDTLQAAILLPKLAIFESELDARLRAAIHYDSLFQGLESEGLIRPAITPGNVSSWAQYTLRVRNRDRTREVMDSHKIPTAVHYPSPLNEQPAYSALCCQGCTPNAARLGAEVISIPMHPYLQEEDQRRVANAVRESLG